MADKKRIAFHFQPYQIDKKLHAITKTTEQGGERKYLEGIASGIKKDEHGEMMTADCIKDFMEQGNSGDILLYADMHGFKATEDIGILEKAEILKDGSWHISSRLYDEKDGVDDRAIQIANKLWKQINGLPPYKKPRQKGFSIEGLVPDDGIIRQDLEGRRTLAKVNLDGLVVVPRPAYKDSIAHAVYKALDELPPWTANSFQENIRSKLRDKLALDEVRDSYYKRRYQIDDIFQDQITEIMSGDSPNKKELLQIAYDEYTMLMIELILQSEGMFDDDTDNQIVLSDNSKQILFKELSTNLKKLSNRIGGCNA